MAALRFRSAWIEPILTGAKSSTLRRDVSSAVRVGELVDAVCRYDRPPFALLRVDAVEAVLVRELDVEQREQVKRLYPRAGALVRVRFAVVRGVSPTSDTAVASSSASPQ